MTQRLKVVPSSVAYDIAGDYFQALCHIIAPAAQIVQQQSSLIDTFFFLLVMCEICCLSQ